MLFLAAHSCKAKAQTLGYGKTSEEVYKKIGTGHQKMKVKVDNKEGKLPLLVQNEMSIVSETSKNYHKK